MWDHSVLTFLSVWPLPDLLYLHNILKAHPRYCICQDFIFSHGWMLCQCDIHTRLSCHSSIDGHWIVPIPQLLEKMLQLKLFSKPLTQEITAEEHANSQGREWADLVQASLSKSEGRCWKYTSSYKIQTLNILSHRGQISLKLSQEMGRIWYSRQSPNTFSAPTMCQPWANSSPWLSGVMVWPGQRGRVKLFSTSSIRPSVHLSILRGACFFILNVTMEKCPSQWVFRR